MGEATTGAPFSDDMTAIAEVGTAMSAALHEGNAVVSICTSAQRQSLEQYLVGHGVDLVAESAGGKYTALDAVDVLSSVIVAGVPDVIRFAEVVGATLDRAAQRHRRVLVFAELAPLLRTQENHAGAMELENLWRSFIASRTVFRDCR